MRLLLGAAVVAVTGLASAFALLVAHDVAAGACLLALSAGTGTLAAVAAARSIRRLEDRAAQAPSDEDAGRAERAVMALAQELDAPLVTMGDAAVALAAELPAPERERLAALVRGQSQRLRDLAGRVGQLSRLEGQRTIAAPREIDLLALIDEVATERVPLAIQRGVGLVWEARAAITVVGDSGALALLFSDLWANALDFSPEGTTLTVALRREGRQAVFTLRDEGPGVSDFALPQLGQRFFSMPRPRDGLRGSGLGLAIARQVAALHGGALAFERAAPGLRVTVRLAI